MPNDLHGLLSAPSNFPDMQRTTGPSFSSVKLNILLHLNLIKHSCTSNSYSSSSPVPSSDSPLLSTRLCWTNSRTAANVLFLETAESRDTAVTPSLPLLSRVEATRWDQLYLEGPKVKAYTNDITESLTDYPLAQSHCFFPAICHLAWKVVGQASDILFENGGQQGPDILSGTAYVIHLHLTPTSLFSLEYPSFSIVYSVQSI
jgi:hypothetical protein